MFSRITLLGLLLVARIAHGADAGHGASSPEGLVQQVLAGLEARDEQQLKQLVITQAEFMKYVWPTAAATVSNGGMTNAAQYYKVYRQSSDVGLADRLATLGGQKWELVKVSVGPERKGKGFRLLSRPEAVIRNAGGEERTVAIAGTVLDEGGSFKIATFYVRETSGSK